MRTALVEFTNGKNWGKALVAQFDDAEWHEPSHILDADTGEGLPDLKTPLLRQRGWTREHVLVLDIETGEGALFRIGGYAQADLQKRRIWVCPLFEPFLTRLYEIFDGDVKNLAPLIWLSEDEAPFSFSGYRREGDPPLDRNSAHELLRDHILNTLGRAPRPADLRGAEYRANHILAILLHAGITHLQLEA